MEPKRNEFRERMNQFKKAREANPQLSYWEWKAIPKYDEGTEGIKMTPEQEKKFLEDRQKYAAMSGAISPALDIRTAADFTPIGNAIASKEIYDATSSGNYLDAGIIGASLVVPPVLAKPIKRYIPTVTRSVEDKINALLNKDKIFKETEWNNTVNRAIERIYDKDVRDRAAQIKAKYGVDIQSQYDAIDDLYTNDYESIPKARIMHIDDGARAKMHTNPTASKAWATEGKPAGMKDFEMQVRPDVEPSKEVAEHEVNHWWTYSMMQNPDWRRSELQKITKGFEGALHKTNPLDPDNSDYYRDWMEQNAYGINVVNSMKELGIPFTKENVIKFINQKPDTSAQKRAARQFKNMDLYYKWLQTMPLAGIAGAAYMLGNKEDNSYSDGTDGITQSYSLPEIVVTPSEYQNYYMENIRPKDMPKGEYFLKTILPPGLESTRFTKEQQDDRLRRLKEIYELAGEPTVHYKGIIDRPHYIPILNSIYSANNDYNLISELAHPIQLKKGKNRHFIKNAINNTIDDIRGSRDYYKDKDNYEYETHSIIEPALRNYIQNKYDSLEEALK